MLGVHGCWVRWGGQRWVAIRELVGKRVGVDTIWATVSRLLEIWVALLCLPFKSTLVEMDLEEE